MPTVTGQPLINMNKYRYKFKLIIYSKIFTKKKIFISNMQHVKHKNDLFIILFSAAVVILFDHMRTSEDLIKTSVFPINIIPVARMLLELLTLPIH